MVISRTIEGSSGGLMEVEVHDSVAVTPPGELPNRPIRSLTASPFIVHSPLLWRHPGTPRSTHIVTPPILTTTPRPVVDEAVTVNPFTPEGRSAKASHSLDLSPTDAADKKRPRMQDFVTRRFEDEFVVLETISEGQFGNVVKCMNKISGVMYAVKKRPVDDEETAWKEVMAYSAVSHPFVVRHCSSWSESGSVYLQTELCESSLETSSKLETTELLSLLRCTTEALRYLHAEQLAHCAVRPRAVLVSSGPRLFYQQGAPREETRFKLGGLRWLTPIGEPPPPPIDRRYVAREMFTASADLAAADVYALALTVYVAGSGVSLPSVGRAWSALRARPLPPLPHPVPPELSSLLRLMASTNPSCRPSPTAILDYITKLEELFLRRKRVASST